MTYCSKCGKQVQDGSEICINCGQPIVAQPIHSTANTYGAQKMPTQPVQPIINNYDRQNTLNQPVQPVANYGYNNATENGTGKNNLIVYNVISCISFILSVIGMVVFIINKEYIGQPAIVREVHNEYAEYYGGLTAEALEAIAIIGLIAFLLFLALGVFFIIKHMRIRKQK